MKPYTHKRQLRAKATEILRDNGILHGEMTKAVREGYLLIVKGEPINRPMKALEFAAFLEGVQAAKILRQNRE